MAFSAPSDDIERQAPPPGTALSLNADEDVIAGQVVKLGSDNGCEPSDTDGEEVIGVTAQTVSSGDQTTVLSSGARVLYTAGTGTVSAGQKLASHGGSGEEGQVARADSTGDFIVGYALEGASSQGDTFVGIVDLGGEVN